MGCCLLYMLVEAHGNKQVLDKIGRRQHQMCIKARIKILTADAICATGETVTLQDTGKTSSPPKRSQMWSNGKVRDVPVIDRTTMSIGAVSDTPLTLPTNYAV